MSTLNKSIIGEYQTDTIENKLSKSLNGVDINYKGYDRTDDSSVVSLYKYSAHINRVLLWLSSKRDDYVRESLKGGVLYDLLGQLCNTTNLNEWEDSIKNRFNEDFSGDLDLLYIKLTADKSYRKLYINMIVRDKLENLTFNVSTEANL